VHDTVQFEKRGIPATTIITEAFKPAAEFQFRGKGMPGHEFIQLPHPVSNLSKNEMQKVTYNYVDRIVTQIVK
tara:strand:+ start:16260 stop:16478 length:219 start_codon:yes stop_codon:yes gene_type:complete